MQTRTLTQHLEGAGPKRILALDGGGIRGILTLGYLQRIETILRERYQAGADFRLCDYFDLIGGTSTGSIIAAGLALGFSVNELLELYRSLGREVFKQSGWAAIVPFARLGVLDAKFPKGPAERALKHHIKEDRTLGDPDLRTGLMVMTKRLDTASPWPLHNNPKGRYYNQRAGGTGIPNREFRLWQIVRASTAAPHYFEPERVRVASKADGRAVDGAFVDGGVSAAGNPSLQLFLMATLEGFHLNWPRGEDQLLLVSVGTGYEDIRVDTDSLMDMPAAMMTLRALTSIMGDCDAQARLMMQLFGRTLYSMPMEIDREVGDLANDVVDARKLLSYVRYNAMLDRGWLSAELRLDYSKAEAASLAAMDNASNIKRLETIGGRAAEVQVRPEHLPAAFDAGL